MAFLSAVYHYTIRVDTGTALCVHRDLANTRIKNIPQDRHKTKPSVCYPKAVRFAPRAQERCLDEIIGGRYRPGKTNSERPQILDIGNEVAPELIRRQCFCDLACSVHDRTSFDIGGGGRGPLPLRAKPIRTESWKEESESTQWNGPGRHDLDEFSMPID